MISNQVFVLLLLGSVIVLLTGFWIVIPILYGLPWVPTQRKRIRRALELSKVRPGEIVYDLGAGDGRVLIVAAREFGARAVGIEIDPVHCAVAWLRAFFSGARGSVSIRREDFFKTDLEDADVVFAYLTSAHAARLQPLLDKQLRPGARVVAISADLKGWQPAAFDSEYLIFMYQMPAKPGNLDTFLAQQDIHRSEG
jgi:SAM-dependent methyltransferase